MASQIATRVRERKLTYLGENRLFSIESAIAAIKYCRVAGNFVEFGIASGGSGICIASMLGGGRRYIGFDVFGMIPPPGEKDDAASMERFRIIKEGRSSGVGGEKYYGYIDNLHDLVVKNFSDFGLVVDGDRIVLVPGLFEDTLPRQPEQVIAFAHIDCDWYDPVMQCLEYVVPRLSVGGIIILDDYGDWAGCRKAADEFLARHPELTIVRVTPHAVISKRHDAAPARATTPAHVPVAAPRDPAIPMEVVCDGGVICTPGYAQANPATVEVLRRRQAPVHAWQAVRDTFLKARPIYSDVLPENQKIKVVAGSVLSGEKSGTADGHLLITEATLNGDQLAGASWYMYEEHWLEE